MYDKIHEIAQAKLDRAIGKLVALTGKGGGLLPAAEDGKALIGLSGTWVPTAIAGGAASASLSDPMNLGVAFHYDPRIAGAQITGNVASRMWFYRVINGANISKIAVDVKVVSGNLAVAVYANSGSGRSAVPAARLATSGTVACPASGYAEVALDVAVDVKAGQHWLAIVVDNTTAQFAGIASAGSPIQQGLSGYADIVMPPPAVAPTLSWNGARQLSVLGVA